MCNICFKILSKHLLAGTEVCGDVWYVWQSADLAAVSCTVGFVTNVLRVAQEDTFTDMWNLITYLAPHLCRDCISSLHHIGFECSMPDIHLCCQLCISSQLYSYKIFGDLLLSFEPSFTAVWSCVAAMSYLLVRVHLVVWLRCNVEEGHIKNICKNNTNHCHC